MDSLWYVIWMNPQESWHIFLAVWQQRLKILGFQEDLIKNVISLAFDNNTQGH
jgi:hypothetical protein